MMCLCSTVIWSQLLPSHYLEKVGQESLNMPSWLICSLSTNDVWRCGLWEIIRVMWDHEGGTWSNAVSVLIERVFSLFLSIYMHWGKAMWGYSNSRKEFSPDTNPAGNFNFDFQSSELWEVNSCSLNHPVYGILLWQLTDTPLLAPPSLDWF